ncbi:MULTISPECIES: nucleoside triphosphate pyrophosphatase [unclassified Herbaspirillum]|uniref:Maf family protein n=1 Tax=unclassified Herbaspirillum TaxID=2624150 RepID=UPI00114E95CC|nr:MULTISPECIES: Maf family protein [unclassified Herbaspirillum]MBB5391418.1 septum formation protein [Herbaspirillum sp. SJZ102]TQK12897.1 septum formation protein [Herbaspirillum sp. SJZ130]TQK14901.1 septum formation protein [Herbaspirillum sp. SJZ106]TWC67256.1 septum formation protein [Herbaspirillum sp. SJZ099]
MKPADQKIYLASKSPRRRELLRQIGIDFELLLSEKEVDESVLPDESPLDYVARVTRDKLNSAQQTMILRQLPHRPILAADTTVVIDQLILGKPADHDEAVRMITRLSGRTHQVLTSIAVGLTIGVETEVWQITQQSDVSFAELGADAIAAYCNTLEPYDKAGAYGIQGLASMFVSNIVGSHSGIMGLPLFETAQLLQKAGVRIL